MASHSTGNSTGRGGSGGDGDPLANEIIQKNQAYDSEISVWRTEWQCISDYTMPRKSQIDERSTPGVDDYLQDIYDTEAMHSAGVLSAGTLDITMSGIFFQNQSPDPEAPQDAQDWYRKTGETQLDIMLASNLYQMSHSCLHARGVFGTAHMMIEEDNERVIFATSEDVGTFKIDVNHRGEVDTVYVEKDWTAKQWVDEFGIDQVAQPIREQYDSERKGSSKGGTHGKFFKYIYAIEPRPASERQSGKLDGKNKPWRAVHVDKEHQKVMREGGFDEFPVMITRFLLWNLFEKYGYGPGFEGLPETRGVNFFEKIKKVLAERQVTPPILVPDNQEGHIDIRPAGKTHFDSKNPAGKAHAWMMEGRYDVAKEELADSRLRIQRTWFVPLFQLLTNSSEVRREKTAFEVGQMLAEQVKNFSPTFTLLKEDFLNPMLARVFSICLRSGRFPPPPDSVFKQTAEGFSVPTPKVNHVSKVAMLIKSIENENYVQFLNLAGLLIQMSPAAQQAFERKFNAGRSLTTMADNLGVVSDFRNTEEEEEEVIAQQEADAQAQQAAEAAAVAKDAAGAVGALPPGLAESIPPLQ